MKFYNKNIEDVFEELKTSESGLSSKEAETRILKYGKNELEEKKKQSWFLKFLAQFNDLMIIILLIVAVFLVFYGVFVSHEYTDATCQKPATCKRCGDETGGKANHSFPKVSCTMVAKCRWCEKKQRGEHQWVTEGKERTCSVCQISQALKQPKPDPEYTE